ncbi:MULTISPECIES: hypothetical protein [unclassified Okeania]|uniref:hypothetical protein n=1 Tax=unclassified Okeania TaxID=2634635 RepID=UPI00257FF1CE|nr:MULTISPECIES: hypothetical protein [unclassified Okeania]
MANYHNQQLSKCQSSSSFTDQEWVLIEPLLPKKKENLSHDRGAKDKYWMVYSINLKMVVIGLIYSKIYLFIP